MKNGYTSYTLEKSKVHLVVPKELKQNTKLNLYWGESKGSINILFDKDELTKYFHLNLKKSEEKSETLRTVFDETTYFLLPMNFLSINTLTLPLSFASTIHPVRHSDWTTRLNLRGF